MVFLLSLALAEKPGSALKSAQQSPFALNRANQTLLPITEASRFDLFEFEMALDALDEIIDGFDRLVVFAQIERLPADRRRARPWVDMEQTDVSDRGGMQIVVASDAVGVSDEDSKVFRHFAQHGINDPINGFCVRNAWIDRETDRLAFVRHGQIAFAVVLNVISAREARGLIESDCFFDRSHQHFLR